MTEILRGWKIRDHGNIIPEIPEVFKLPRVFSWNRMFFSWNRSSWKSKLKPRWFLKKILMVCNTLGLHKATKVCKPPLDLHKKPIHEISAGADPGFLKKGGGVHRRSTMKEGSVQEGSNFGPNVKKPTSWPKRGGGPGPPGPPPDPPMCMHGINLSHHSRRTTGPDWLRPGTWGWDSDGNRTRLG